MPHARPSAASAGRHPLSCRCDIQRSLEIIFSTALGERIMNPTFGCALDEMVFEPMNTGKLAYLANLLKTAILYHEPRIDAEQIEVRPDDRRHPVALGRITPCA